MDVIPGDAVVPARGDTLAHGEHQPLSPGHVDPVQRQLTLPVVGEVSFPWEGVRMVRLTWVWM